LPQYKIPGFGKKTGRKRSKVYVADTLDEALQLAYADETIVDPAAIEVMPEDAATKPQLRFAKKIGVAIPARASKRQARNMLTDAIGDRSMLPPTYKQIRFARRLGIVIERRMTRDDLSAAIDAVLQYRDPPKRGFLTKLFDAIQDAFH
jgi:hypothetical protein